MHDGVYQGKTPEEHYRATGALPQPIIEWILDKLDLLKKQPDLKCHMQEARAQYPAEDFLSEVESELADLEKRVRGDNKELLKGIRAKLEDIAQTTFNSADYGREELDKALKALIK